MAGLLRGYVDKAYRSYEKLRDKLMFREKYGEYRVAKYSVRKRVVVINWNSDEGRQMLMHATYNQDFFRLAHAFQPQINPFFCSVACMVTVLNALRLPRGIVPSQKGFDFVAPDGKTIHYKMYSQLTLLNEETEQVKRKEDIAPSMRGGEVVSAENYAPGLTLGQVQQMLEIYGAQTELHYAAKVIEKGLPLFIEVLKNTLLDSEALMIVNYEGQVMGLSTGGHYSVVGAYDQASDHVLVLDTAAHKNPWYWVPTKHLYHAMHAMAGEHTRGYLIVWDEANAEGRNQKTEN